MPKDEVLRQLIYYLLIPIPAEMIRSLHAQAERAFPFGCMRGIDFGWGKQVERRSIGNSILIECLILLRELIIEENFII
jgi:hypothetical protein